MIAKIRRGGRNKEALGRSRQTRKKAYEQLIGMGEDGVSSTGVFLCKDEQQ